MLLVPLVGRLIAGYIQDFEKGGCHYPMQAPAIWYGPELYDRPHVELDTKMVFVQRWSEVIDS